MPAKSFSQSLPTIQEEDWKMSKKRSPSVAKRHNQDRKKAWRKKRTEGREREEDRKLDKIGFTAIRQSYALECELEFTKEIDAIWSKYWDWSDYEEVKVPDPVNPNDESLAKNQVCTKIM